MISILMKIAFRCPMTPKAMPRLSGMRTRDEGALLIADGQIVATFAGHAALDLAGVPIVFTALDPAA